MALPSAYLTEVRKRNPRLITWVEIEGLEWGFSNDDAPSNFSTRWSSGAGSTTGPKGVKATLLSVPTPVELSIDPLQTMANIGQTIVRLHDAESLLVKAVSVHRTEDEVFLSADISASATSLTYVGSASTSVYPTGGGTLYLDAETIKYTSHDTGTKTFSGLTRAMYGSTAVKHLKGRPVTHYPRFLKSRKVTWYFSRHPDLTSASDEVVRFRGVITDYAQAEDASAFTLTVEHDLRRLDGTMFSWQVSGRLHAIRDFGTGDTAIQLVPDQSSWYALYRAENSNYGPGDKWVDGYGFQDDTGLVLALMDEDSRIYICEMVPPGGLPRVIGVLHGSVPFDNGVLKEDIVQDPLGRAFKEIWDIGAIYTAVWPGATVPAPGDRLSNDGFATRCYQAYQSDNVVDMVLAHLLSDGVRNTGVDYKWFGIDGSGNGLNDGWAGLTTSEVDVASFESVRDKHLWSSRYIGWLDGPVTILDFLVNELLRPHGLFYSITDEGKLTLKRITIPFSQDPSGLAQFDETKILPDSTPQWNGNARTTFVGVTVKNPVYGGVIFSALLADAQWYYGRRGEHIELETKNREFRPYSEPAIALAGLYRERFEYPGPLLALSTDYSLHEVAVGDIVRVSLKHIPDTAEGSLGLTDRLAYVMSKRTDDMAGRIDWVLEVSAAHVEDAGGGGDPDLVINNPRRRYCLISPTMEVESVGASNTVTVKANSYTTAPTKDWDDFRVGDRVRITTSSFGTVRYTAAVINAIDSATRQVTLDNNATIQAGDIITLSDYATTVASGTAKALRYAFMADSSGDLDPSGTATNDRRMYVYME